MKKKNPCIFNYCDFTAVAVISAFNWASPGPSEPPAGAKLQSPPRICSRPSLRTGSAFPEGWECGWERLYRARAPPVSPGHGTAPLFQQGICPSLPGDEAPRAPRQSSSALPSSEGKSRTWQKQKFLGNQALNLSHKYHNSLTDPAIIRSWPMSDIRTQFVELMCHMK